MLGKTTHALTVPIGLDAAFDVLKSRILIHVDRAPGMRNCIVELSTEPIGLGTWNRLPGFGAVKTLTGYAPGTYWVRAASARAKDESDFIGPVSVIVK